MLGIKRQRGEAGTESGASSCGILRTAKLCRKRWHALHSKSLTDVHHIDGSWKEKSDWVLFIGGVGTLENPTPNLMSLCHFHHSQITMDSIKSGEAVDHSKGVEQCRKA